LEEKIYSVNLPLFEVFSRINAAINPHENGILIRIKKRAIDEKTSLEHASQKFSSNIKAGNINLRNLFFYYR